MGKAASQPRTLDDLILLATNDPSDIIAGNDSYQALVCTTSQLSPELLRAIKSILETHHFALILLDDGRTASQMLQKHELLHQMASQQNGLTLTTSPRLYVFSYGQQFLAISKHIWRLDHQGDSNPSNDLTLIYDHEDSSSYQTISNLLAHTGQLPNIIVTERAEQLFPLVDSLRQINWYTARVTENNQNLSDVSWVGIDSLVSSGKVHHWQQRVRPYKRGYRFSPDVLSFNAINSETTKRFIATRLDLADQQLLYLDFEQPTQLEQAVYANVNFTNDPVRGRCIQLASTEHYIDLGTIFPKELTEISVAVWIRPDSLSGNHSIIGVGEDFSVKIQEGNMCFTTPDVLDHIATHDSIALHQWHHLAYVLTQQQDLYFYLNGKLVDMQKASNLESTAASLLIGSNLWEEAFNGKMDDLRIWTRALSTREVHELFETPPGEPPFNWWYLSVLVLLPLLLLLRKGKKASGTASNHHPTINLQLQVFGQFRLYDLDGNELTQALSPQRLELLLVLLFYATEQKGISSTRLNDLLWEGYDSERAKNSRSTQVSKLRELLSQNTGIQITYSEKRWRLLFDEKSSCDLHLIHQLLERQQPANDLTLLLQLISAGPMLPNYQFEWLDTFKSNTHHQLINYLSTAIETCPDPQLLHQCCDAIFKIDPLNEPTLKHKIGQLIKDGKHGLAKSTFDQFCRTYQAYYSETFTTSYSDFVSSLRN